MKRGKPLPKGMIKNKTIKDLEWNGTLLNPEDIIINKISEEHGRNLCVCEIKGVTYACIQYKINNSVVCMINEMKKFCGIPTEGTLRYSLNNEMFLISPYDYSTENDEIIIKIPGVLSERTDLHKNKNFRYEMQRLLIFRELLGIPTRKWDTIEIRNNIPVCIFETWSGKISRELVLSRTAFEKWFESEKEHSLRLEELLSIFKYPKKQIPAEFNRLNAFFDHEMNSYVANVQLRVNDIVPDKVFRSEDYVDDSKAVVGELLK